MATSSSRAAAPTAIVVGGGFGGLAAAIRLASRGHRVTLLERQDQFGGRGMVFRQDGFSFDAGPTVITAPFLLEELFALSGRKMEEYLTLKPVDPWYRVVFPDGRSFDYVGDEERTIDQIRKFNPRDVDGWRRLKAHADDIYSVGFEKLADVPFSKLSDMARALPQMAEIGAPVIFDATHAVQQPGGQGTSSGGDRRFVPVLARAAVAVGVAGLFIETHQDPDHAPSDGPNMVPLKDFAALIADLQAIDRVVKSQKSAR